MSYLNLNNLQDAIIKYVQAQDELQSIKVITNSLNDNTKLIQDFYIKATTTCLCIHNFVPASVITHCPGPLFPKIYFNVTITSPTANSLKCSSPTEVAQKICNTLHFQTIHTDTIAFFIILEEKEFWKSEDYFITTKPHIIELKFTAIPQDA